MHNRRVDKYPYLYDCRADKDSYPHEMKTLHWNLDCPEIWMSRHTGDMFL